MNCPECGRGGAYQGMMVVECAHIDCRHYTERQEAVYKAELERRYPSWSGTDRDAKLCLEDAEPSWLSAPLSAIARARNLHQAIGRAYREKCVVSMPDGSTTVLVMSAEGSALNVRLQHVGGCWCDTRVQSQAGICNLADYWTNVIVKGAEKDAGADFAWLRASLEDCCNDRQMVRLGAFGCYCVVVAVRGRGTRVKAWLKKDGKPSEYPRRNETSSEFADRIGPVLIRLGTVFRVGASSAAVGPKVDLSPFDLAGMLRNATEKPEVHTATATDGRYHVSFPYKMETRRHVPPLSEETPQSQDLLHLHPAHCPTTLLPLDQPEIPASGSAPATTEASVDLGPYTQHVWKSPHGELLRHPVLHGRYDRCHRTPPGARCSACLSGSTPTERHRRGTRSVWGFGSIGSIPPPQSCGQSRPAAEPSEELKRLFDKHNPSL